MASDVKVNRYVLSELAGADLDAIASRARPGDAAVEARAREIIDDVRARGDEALLEHTRQLDGADLAGRGLKVSQAEFDAAEAQVSPQLREALEQVVANVTAHHRAQMPPATWMREVAPGVIAGERVTPVASVGLYVPRGKGSFPSVTVMLCVPAVLAGVPYVAVCTPPNRDGTVDPASLVAARMCGVTEVFKVGGAQAIAALAYGTGTVPRVEKVMGPGNPYVAAAKRLLYGVIDPGTPAGPSESVVLCDAHADPETAARELLVEAEHGPDSAALLVTDSEPLADAVERRLPALLEELPPERRGYCEAVLGGLGGIVLAADLTEAISFVNRYAPEHLRVLVTDPFSVLHRITNAGEVLLGPTTSIAFGNFSIGVNAILPTGGRARSASCVGVADFLKRSSFAYVSPGGVDAVGPAAAELARYEGFPAHAAAAEHAIAAAKRLGER